MKSFKTTALLTALISLSAITTTVIKPASAQTGYDPYSGLNYDTSDCAGYNSCYVDNWGGLHGSDNLQDPYDYTYDDSSYYIQLQ